MTVFLELCGKIWHNFNQYTDFIPGPVTKFEFCRMDKSILWPAIKNVSVILCQKGYSLVVNKYKVPWVSEAVFSNQPLTTNRDSIQRLTNAKKSNYDDNPRSWIKFKVDILIPVVENTTQKYHQGVHKRVSNRVSALSNHSKKICLLFRFHCSISLPEMFV